MEKFEIKNMLKLDSLYEKKLLVIAYYAAIFISVITMFAIWVTSIINMADDNITVLAGLWAIFSSPFILIFKIIIIRVIAEVIAAIFDIKNKK